MTTLSTRLRRAAAPLRAATATALILSLATHSNPVIHGVTGVAFAVAATGHTLANGRWLRTVGRRLRRGVPRVVAVDAAVAATTIVLAMIVVATGIAALATGGDGASHGVSRAHGPCAILLTVTVTVHAVRHVRRRWRRHATEAASGGTTRSDRPNSRSNALTTVS
jgi:hypothetical protein